MSTKSRSELKPKANPGVDNVATRTKPGKPCPHEWTASQKHQLDILDAQYCLELVKQSFVMKKTGVWQAKATTVLLELPAFKGKVPQTAVADIKQVSKNV
jgi:hypothetical protein